LGVSKRTAVSLMGWAVGWKVVSSFNEVRGCVEVSTKVWVKEGGVFGCRDKCLSGGRIVGVR
jgi:hypothetical protein